MKPYLLFASLIATNQVNAVGTLEASESCFNDIEACGPGLCCGTVFGKVDEDKEGFTLCWPKGEKEWCDDTFEEELNCEWGYAFNPLYCPEGAMRVGM